MNFNFNNPYTTTRTPVFARNVVSTSHPLASTAGLRMRLLGGNAVDAAIAAAAVMTIVEPVSNGLGSDSFCLIWDGKELHGLNASGRAPQAWTPEYFKSKYPGNGSGNNAPPKRGMDSVTVPGAVAIIPAFLTKDGKPVMSFGVMGANMQPQGHLQTLVRMLDYGQSPQAACDAPRWRYNTGLEINVEGAMNQDVVQALAQRGHRMEVIHDSYQDFGAGQFIWLAGDPKVEGYVAASDSRRDGQAVGF
jgi:gamma-glutamyltranspeptidase